MKVLFTLLVCLPLFGAAQNYYIVRHAEKEVVPADADRAMRADPALSADGRQRAVDLQSWMLDKNIAYVFSTPFKRTISTATPTSAMAGKTVIHYSPSPDSLDQFITNLKLIKNGNVLIVGHSNTIDDIANKLAGKNVVAGDLPETEYNNIFIVRREGEKYVFEGKKYGK